VLLFSVLGAHAEESPANDTSHSPASFVREWRVVLRGKEAERMNWSMRNSTLDGRELSPSELDSIEQQLLPTLAMDLSEAGSSDPPSEYYRQYASGKWKQYHVVFIKGFHRTYFDLPFGSVAERDRWKHEPIDAADGGTAFWDAVYVVELRKFATMKKTGHASHTVAFHGVA
jgi:hypothetical protein